MKTLLTTYLLLGMFAGWTMAAGVGATWPLQHIPGLPGWKTELQVENPTDKDAVIEVAMFDQGLEITHTTESISPYSRTRLPVETGTWARVDGDNPKLSVTVLYTNGFGNQARLGLTPGDSNSLRLSVLQEVGWQGFVLLNANRFDVRATLTARKSDGSPADVKTMTLPRLSREVFTVADLFMGVDAISSIDVSADFPLSGLALAGVEEQLQAAPAFHAAPDPDEAALKSFLKDWFKDYNQNQNLAYLELAHQTFPDGDPERPSLPSHIFHRDVAYGPFPRNVMDFWQVSGDGARPVLVFIHGGGFVGGSKSQVSEGLVRTMLEAGISVAAIHYRWAARTESAALAMPIPNGEGSVHDLNGARLDYILRDCARSIQFLRYKADDWRIDGGKIAAAGGSAGAGASMWIGTVPDLAEPNHSDPVLRESTRISAIGHSSGQPTYNWSLWPELLDFTPAVLFDWIGVEDIRLLQLSRDDQRFTAFGRDLLRVVDYYGHLSEGDPPIITLNAGEDLDENQITNGSEVIHHPRAHAAIYEKCRQLDIPCEIRTKTINDSPHQGNLAQFMIDMLQR